MNIGMLWLDNDKSKSLESRVLNARRYYINKYQIIPNACRVNPSMMPEGEEKIVFEGVEVIGSHRILPNHFWIGVSEDEDESAYRKPLLVVEDEE